MGRHDSTKAQNSKWFTSSSSGGPLYTTGLTGNKTVVQLSGANMEWVIKSKKRLASRSTSAMDGDLSNHTTIDDVGEDIRLFNRHPSDPYVRACLIAKEFKTKEKQKARLWTDNLDRIDRARAKDKQLFGDRNGDTDELKDNMSTSQEQENTKITFAEGPPNTRTTTVWTRPGTIPSRWSSASGGHHMLSRSSMREIIYNLPNPEISLSDFSDYERIQTSNDEKSSPCTYGSDFLGSRRVIGPRMSLASTIMEDVPQPPVSSEFLPFRIRRSDITSKLDARPSPLTGRQVSDFNFASVRTSSCSNPLNSSQQDMNLDGKTPISMRVERRLQAALQGASTFNVSKLSYINPTMNDEKLLKVAGLFVQNRDVIKNIQGGLR